LTILLDAPVETGMSRAGRRSAPDRWESEEFDFFARVREAYLRLAAEEPERIIIVDATQTMDAVRNQIVSIARSILDT
jgi:dTMP kinase